MDSFASMISDAVSPVDFFSEANMGHIFAEARQPVGSLGDQPLRREQVFCPRRRIRKGQRRLLDLSVRRR
jgi:hypothetical protein